MSGIRQISDYSESRVLAISRALKEPLPARTQELSDLLDQIRVKLADLGEMEKQAQAWQVIERMAPVTKEKVMLDIKALYEAGTITAEDVAEIRLIIEGSRRRPILTLPPPLQVTCHRKPKDKKWVKNMPR
jgi:hypothetical protein